LTPLNDRIKDHIHYWVKPTLSYMVAVSGGRISRLILEKDRKGWDSQLVRKLRKVFDRWIEREIDYGSLKARIYRPWLRKLFDLICLAADVEPHKLEQSWNHLKEELKREGLL